MAADTKEKILTTAETLFAEQGIANTSLRHITQAAQVNLASVNYHFGS
ncbi:MAG TPA: TetR family transcriptional regulator, partial [Gammaproteobacteria bacterium]|nr:TetR family transcriptional regulator [Gammaproteobacteria bacterium]